VASHGGHRLFQTGDNAAGRDNLRKIGLLLFLASAIHNLLGYFFGYC